MRPLDNKVIVYDSNCKVCSSWKDIVISLTRIPESKVKAYKDLSDGLDTKVDLAKFQNAMALVDTNGGPTLYGTEGIAYIFSSQFGIAAALFKFRPALRMFDFLYKTQAYNRYIIATPKSKFMCDCFPDRIVKYRISYIVICVIISLMLTALLGVSLKSFAGVSLAASVAQMLLIAGTGWVLQILLAIVILKEKALDYIAHLGSIMVTGLLVLIPWILLHWIAGVKSYYIPIISVTISSTLMLYLHIHRVRHLQLSQAWTISWFLFLQATAVAWIYTFYIQ
ncbi:hypothetical protein WBG78_22605 [Chryseolinea sp. T2]|uniref:hypothetical protein n=1 Tax=Chryseolinea sp. T2 TaxID=3129255 RepID=UPI003077660D